MGIEYYLADLDTKEHIGLGKKWTDKANNDAGFQMPTIVIVEFLNARCGHTFRFDTDGDLDRLDDEGSVEIDTWNEAQDRLARLK